MQVHQQSILSQIPNFHKLSWLSIVAAIMSFSYAGIGMGLSFAKVVSGKGEKTTLTGVEIGLDLTVVEKTWRIFQAMGDMALACAYSAILIEVQDTLRSSPPENKVMKKGKCGSYLCRDNSIHDVRLLWLRRAREPCTWQPLDWLWILRAILADRLG
ncbi:hypothetical protein Q3G72_025177 [Acer saccharum]|nr:hypothetical protein Q3G72_025177 [Acer saccharum]